MVKLDTATGSLLEIVDTREKQCVEGAVLQTVVPFLPGRRLILFVFFVTCVSLHPEAIFFRARGHGRLFPSSTPSPKIRVCESP